MKNNLSGNDFYGLTDMLFDHAPRLVEKTSATICLLHVAAPEHDWFFFITFGSKEEWWNEHPNAEESWKT